MSGVVRIEFAQKFTHPTRQVVTRRREGQAVYRDRAADRLTAFMTLLNAVPLIPDLLAQLIRDPVVCRDRCSEAVNDRRLQGEFRDIWASPAAYMFQAQDIAELLSRNGAPWALVLPVLIAERDHDFKHDVSGWQGWHAMTDAHEAVRNVLGQMRHAYEWEPGHFENLLDGLLYCLLTEDAYEGWHLGRRSIPTGGTSLPWDGSSPRSVDAYAARPGDFHPGMALTFVREVPATSTRIARSRSGSAPSIARSAWRWTARSTALARHSIPTMRRTPRGARSRLWVASVPNGGST